MNNILKEKINNYCYQVETGKPIANLPIQKRYIIQALKIIKEYGLKSYEENSAAGWSILWIFKRGYLLEVINNLPEKPKTVYDHWVLGKAFGYSDEAIEEFLLNLTE